MEFIITLSVSIDVFLGVFSCSVNKMKIPLSSVLIILFINTAALILPLYGADFFADYLTPSAAKYIGFGLLFIIGLVSLFGKQKDLFCDKAEVLSPKCAAVLGVAVAIDAAISGFAIGFLEVNVFSITFFSVAFGFISIYSGIFFGQIVNRKVNFSWLGGAILMSMAVIKLI
ncbi:MAG: manganese efflux pump [Ruminococcus sp.]|jgi:putative Mn2+ efflux pump MntP|nr:manganese efflux pump [Ruminococcus sp.]